MNNTPHSPLYAHDCESCKFLGRHGEQDLYVHVGSSRKSGLHQTVIARSSSEGSDYESGMGFSFGLSAALTEARLRAEKFGFIDYPFSDALNMVRPDDGALVEEFLTKAKEEPLLKFVLLLQSDEATPERFASLAQAFIEEQTRRFDEVAPHRYLGWFLERLTKVVRLVYGAQANNFLLWVYAREDEFSATLSQPQAT